MRVPVRAGIAGRYRITELHPDTLKPITGRGGVPIIRDESGFVRPVGDWKKNLITNAGLDSFAANGNDSNNPILLGYSTGSGGYTHARQYLLVGSDATPADVTDVAMGALIGSTSASGGFGYVHTYGDDDGDGHAWTQVEITRVYTASGAQTVRELGFASRSDGTPARFRWIPEDNEGAPVSISLLDGKKLRVDHALKLLVPREVTGVSVPIVELDVAGEEVETRTFTANVYGFADTWANQIGANASGSTGVKNAAGSSAVITERPSTRPSIGSYTVAATQVIGSYTPGSKTISAGGRFSEAQGNGGSGFNTFALGALLTGNISFGFLVCLQDGPHPKDDLHTLEVVLDWTWDQV